MFEDYLTAKYVDISEKELSTKRADEYHIWVKDYVRLINNIMYLIVSIILYIMIFFIYMQVRYWRNTHEFPVWVKNIANGPVNKAKTWPIYFTRGFLFHTQEHGEGRKTCNYGICVKGESYTNASDEADYYGILTDIIQIEYEGVVNLKITLFKCKCYDPVIGRGTRRSNGGIVDVLSLRKYYEYEPFILGTYVLFIHINSYK